MKTVAYLPVERLPWYLRGMLLLAGGGLIAMLGVALWLTPAARGYGTHIQLGLQPCTFTSLVGMRCPSCGMTTSWAHFVRGHWVQAVQSNSGGTLLAFCATLGGPWMLVSGALGRWLFRRPNEWLAVGLAVTIVVVTLADWAYRLMAS